MASWSEDLIPLDISFTSATTGVVLFNSVSIDTGYISYQLGSFDIIYGIVSETGYTSATTGAMQWLGVSINTGHISLFGFTHYNFVNFAKRATLYAGSGMSWRNEGAFTAVARRALLAAYDTAPLATIGTFSNNAGRSTIFFDVGNRISISANKATVSFSGQSHYLNTFNVASKRATLSISGLSGTIGTFSGIAKRSSISTSGFTATEGTFSISAKKGILWIVPLYETFYCDVMCLDNLANSEYDNYQFDSFASTKDYLLGANSTGIYEMTGSDDASTNIDVVIETHQDDFDIGECKHISDLYVTYEGGPIDVRVITEDTVWSGNTLEEITDLKTRRASIGKGIKHINWGVRIEGMNGASVNIDRIELRPFKLSGRV